MTGEPGAGASAGRRGRPGFWGTLGVALAAALSRPASWPLALAAFLLRGGILLFVLPFVILPTPVGLGTVFAPMLFRIAVGQPDARAIAVVGGGIVLLAAWLLVGGAVAAVCETVVIRWGARDVAAWSGSDRVGPLAGDEGGPSDGLETWTAMRVLAVRLLAHVPFVVTLAWFIPQVVNVTYAELQSPSDVTAPLVARVLSRVAGAVTIVAAAWVVGQVLGASAARAAVLGRRGVRGALMAGLRGTARHLLAAAATWLLGMLGSVVLVAPALIAAVAAWDQIRRSLPDDPLGAAPVGAVVVLVVTWSAGLLLAAIAAACRSTWWTGEWLRQRRSPSALEATVGAGPEPVHVPT